jgi:hypothetical protein
VNAQLLGSLPQPDLTCELRAWPCGTWPTLGADSVLSAADVGVLAAIAQTRLRRRLTVDDLDGLTEHGTGKTAVGYGARETQ